MMDCYICRPTLADIPAGDYLCIMKKKIIVFILLAFLPMMGVGAFLHFSGSLIAIFRVWRHRFLYDCKHRSAGNTRV